MTTKLPDTAFHDSATLFPRASRLLRRFQTTAAFTGAVATIALHGQQRFPRELELALNSLVFGALISAAIVLALRYRWSRKRVTFLQQNRFDLGLSVLWGIGLLVIFLLSVCFPDSIFKRDLALHLCRWSELFTTFRLLHEISGIIHHAAEAGMNPALVLVLSFASLIAIGTVLLMLPRCRPAGEPSAPLLKALFTATSASCVTGLVLDPPGSYWSRSGQLVILALIQFGGLGIMTFSAFFALALGRKLPVREQMTFRELLESERIGDVGGMIRAILLLTLGIECVGAVLMSTLWPDLPLLDRAFYGVFHAVSGFCNAGFSLRDANLVGWETKWQVWGVVPALIILGGLGFNVIDNWQRYLRARWLHSRHPFAIVQGTRPRISLTTRLVTLTTACLLVLGTVLVFLFELDNPRHPLPLASQFANAWFQSVTFRTAGFNTIDHEHLRPATKLLGIVFMFIGASPGSTGGGVKTICLALMLITLRSVLRGRPAVETNGRMIPEEQVFRGLAIITLGLATMMLTALFLVMIENEPARLVDQLYEAASAFGTVGVSANLTPTLKPASQCVLIIAMFLGRVGPLTLIVALSGNRRPRNYAFPEERIALG